MIYIYIKHNLTKVGPLQDSESTYSISVYSWELNFQVTNDKKCKIKHDND